MFGFFKKLGGAEGRLRKSFRETAMPLISPRRGRRLLRREQLFSVVRESLIRGGVLSASYEFKVMSLEANGDRFMVLLNLAVPARTMPDEYLLEIESWMLKSAKLRYDIEVVAVYWRRNMDAVQPGVVLKASVSAQSRPIGLAAGAEAPEPTSFGIPVPARGVGSAVQPVAPDEVVAFRRALNADPGKDLPLPEAMRRDSDPLSDFVALSDTQYGKL